MTAPFQPERSELLQPATRGGTGLNAEYASMIQGTQKPSTDKPQVMTADGTQLVIPPIGQTTTDQTAAATTTKPGATADVSQAAAQTQPATEQLPKSVAYDPSLPAPAWQRFSQTPVALDGSLMPASGPGSPGDTGPGPAIPMYMRLAPPGYYHNQPPTDGSTTSTASTDQSGQGQTVTADSSAPVTADQQTA